jgi:formate hydrogenlyase subunit 3/multisubunit Na+/H+ antiporter MnhD subunit
MGLMLLLVGAALATPDRVDLILPVIALYALHHGLAKGALFLSSAVRLPRQRLVRGLCWLLIALPGFSLAGLPWTSGALAKMAMKEAIKADQLAMVMAPYFAILMTAGAVATLLLVLRFLWLLRDTGETGQSPLALTLGWLLASIGSLLLFWWLPWQTEGLVATPYWLPKAYQYWSLLWPILTALAVGGLATRLISRAPRIPPGDVLALLAYSGRWLWSWLGRPAFRGLPVPASLVRLWRQLPGWSAATEQGLRAGGALVLTILILLMAALL